MMGRALLLPARERRRIILPVLLAALLLPGCFQYQAIEPGAARPDEEVRVRITEAAALRLALQFGSITDRLEGRLSPTPVTGSRSSTRRRRRPGRRCWRSRSSSSTAACS